MRTFVGGALRAARRIGYVLGLLFVLAWSLAAVAKDAASATDEQEKSAEQQPAGEAAEPDAAKVLEQLRSTYHAARTYQDEGIFLLKLQRGGGTEEGDFDIRLAFERPNRVSLYFQPPVMPDLELIPRQIVSDGKYVYARTESHLGQVVRVDAPAENVADELFASAAIGPLLSDGLAPGNLVLQLLTSEEIPQLAPERAKLLAPAKIEGKEYRRLQFEVPEGELTLWIDATTSLLRRAEFPTRHLDGVISQQGYTSLSIVAEYNGAVFDEPLPPETFQWVLEEGEEFYHHLVDLPADDPTSALIGEQMPKFGFRMGDEGEVQQSETLQGKVTVLDFWATWCGPCMQSLPKIDKVRNKFADNDQVRFIALNIDSDDATSEQIGQTLKQIEVALPWASLVADDAQKLFEQVQFAGIPAMVVLGQDGRVQYVRVGLDPEVEKTLPELIERLLKGEDVGAETTRIQQQREQARQKLLDAAKVDLTAEE